jgi:HNH endonuclease
MSLLDDDRLPGRFWAKVSPEPNSGCWLWTAYSDPKGYGRFMLREGKPMLAHRMAFIALVRDPGALDLDHLCRVRCCVNPDHLEPVTNAENTRRGRAGENNRTKTHCPKGHAYDAVNTVYAEYEWGTHIRRFCRACHDAANRAYRARKKEECL